MTALTVFDKTYWKKWLKKAGIRAIKTMSQTAISLIGTTTLLKDLDIVNIISASILSGILSLLTSLAGIPELENVKKNKNS